MGENQNFTKLLCQREDLDKALPVSKQRIYLYVFILFALPLLLNWGVLQPELN